MSEATNFKYSTLYESQQRLRIRFFSKTLFSAGITFLIDMLTFSHTVSSFDFAKFTIFRKFCMNVGNGMSSSENIEIFRTSRFLDI